MDHSHQARRDSGLALHHGVTLAPGSRISAHKNPLRAPSAPTPTHLCHLYLIHTLSHVPWDLHASPLTLRSQRAEPHPCQGRREGAAGAHNPGKGEAHWKSQLGVSASEVTGESPHAYQSSSREETWGRGSTGGPGGGAKCSLGALQRCASTQPGPGLHQVPLQSSKPLPALSSSSDAPPQGTVVIPRRNKANLKILSTHLPAGPTHPEDT